MDGASPSTAVAPVTVSSPLLPFNRTPACSGRDPTSVEVMAPPIGNAMMLSDQHRHGSSDLTSVFEHLRTTSGARWGIAEVVAPTHHLIRGVSAGAAVHGRQGQPTGMCVGLCTNTLTVHVGPDPRAQAGQGRAASLSRRRSGPRPAPRRPRRHNQAAYGVPRVVVVMTTIAHSQG